MTGFTLVVCVLALAAQVLWLVFAASPGLLLALLAAYTFGSTIFIGLVAAPVFGGIAATGLPLVKHLLALSLLLNCLRHRRRRARGFSGLAWLGILYAAYLTVYAFGDVSSLTKVAPAPVLARVSSYIEDLVPLLLICAGLQLRRSIKIAYLQRFIVRFSVIAASFAIFALYLVPLSIWVNVSVRASAIGNTSLPRSTFEQGLISYVFGGPRVRAIAPYLSPLTLAFSLVLPLMFLLATGVRTRGDRIALAIIGGALILTQTRAIILGCLVAALTLRSLKGSAIGRRIVLLGGSILLALGPLRAAIEATTKKIDPSALNHASAIQEGINGLIHHPLGVGMGQGGRIGRQLGEGLAGGENLYLVLGRELGWIGLALVCACAIGLGMRLWRLRGRIRQAVHDDGTEGALVTACIASLLVLAGASWTTEHAIAFQSTWLFWITVGYLLGSDIATRERSAPEIRSSVGL